MWSKEEAVGITTHCFVKASERSNIVQRFMTILSQMIFFERSHGVTAPLNSSASGGKDCRGKGS